jgi:hypothetical protein
VQYGLLHAVPQQVLGADHYTRPDQASVFLKELERVMEWQRVLIEVVALNPMQTRVLARVWQTLTNTSLLTAKGIRLIGGKVGRLRAQGDANTSIPDDPRAVVLDANTKEDVDRIAGVRHRLWRIEGEIKADPGRSNDR